MKKGELKNRAIKLANPDDNQKKKGRERLGAVIKKKKSREVK